MAMDITTLYKMVMVFVLLTIWLYHRYEREVWLHAFLMVVWLAVGVSFINTLISDGWTVYLPVACFIIIEYMGFQLIVKNVMERKAN